MHPTGVDDRDYLVESRDTWAALRTGFDMGGALAQAVRVPRRDTVTRDSALFTSRAKVVSVALDGGDGRCGGVGEGRCGWAAAQGQGRQRGCVQSGVDGGSIT